MGKEFKAEQLKIFQQFFIINCSYIECGYSRLMYWLLAQTNLELKFIAWNDNSELFNKVWKESLRALVNGLFQSLNALLNFRYYNWLFCAILICDYGKTEPFLCFLKVVSNWREIDKLKNSSTVKSMSKSSFIKSARKNHFRII